LANRETVKGTAATPVPRLLLASNNGDLVGRVSTHDSTWWYVKVRIKSCPTEPELDGVRLDGFAPGTVRDVSPSLGSWLVAQGYADLEMRQTQRRQDEKRSTLNRFDRIEHARRRSDDR
jgi:hypothetical protein